MSSRGLAGDETVQSPSGRCMQNDIRPLIIKLAVTMTLGGVMWTLRALAKCTKRRAPGASLHASDNMGYQSPIDTEISNKAFSPVTLSTFDGAPARAPVKLCGNLV
ncbi:hypothetical protein J6590_052839 [Homalodisca vitripennis]|nr:hypothetical protein J6590_052839 [Homalodisca vitripennis]